MEQLRELPTPFLAYHTAQSGFYVLVESLTGNRLTFVEPVSGQRQTETLEQFAKHWSGVVLLAEKTSQSGEADYATHRRTEWLNALRLPLAVAAVGLLMLLALSVALPVLTGWQAAWLLTKAVGLTLSIVLVMKQLGHANALADRFCQTLNKAGCESVLSSPAATVVGNVHWSDVGLVYFAGGLLAALWNSTQPQAPLWRPDALIRLGNPEAEHVLTVVTNPYCGPCAQMHRAVEDLLRKRSNLRAEIIFLACDGPTGRTTTMLRHLLTLADKAGALNDWYAQDAKDYAQWANRWPANPEQTPFVQAKEHCDWCMIAQIDTTPTVFVDGYKLPEVVGAK